MGEEFEWLHKNAFQFDGITCGAGKGRQFLFSAGFSSADESVLMTSESQPPSGIQTSPEWPACGSQVSMTSGLGVVVGGGGGGGGLFGFRQLSGRG